MNTNGEVVPARIRPLLRRRIEELRKHKNGASLGGEGTLSKKQLLKGDAAEEEEDDDDQSSNKDENKHKISSKETQHTAKEQSQQTLVRVVTVEKLSKVVPLPASEYGTEEQHNKHEDHSQEKVKDVENKDKVDLVTDNEECAYCIWPPPKNNKHEEVNDKRDDDHDEKDDDDDDDDDDDENEEGEEEDENGRFLGPGSPSFKIYIEDEKIKEEQRENQTIVVHQKSLSADSFESATSASGNSRNSNEVVEIESTTKGKGHKLKKLGAVKKNLLKVKNMQVKHRMNPMFSCAGNDRKSLLSTKSLLR